MLKWIAGGLASVLAVRYLFRLKEASNTLVTKVKVQVHKVSLAGMELKAIVTLQNPNPISLAMQYPFVHISYKGTTLGSSLIKDETIRISAHSQKQFEMLIQTESWITLLQVFGTRIVERIRKGEKVSLDIQARTSTRVNGFPYSEEETITLAF